VPATVRVGSFPRSLRTAWTESVYRPAAPVTSTARHRQRQTRTMDAKRPRMQRTVDVVLARATGPTFADRCVRKGCALPPATRGSRTCPCPLRRSPTTAARAQTSASTTVGLQVAPAPQTTSWRECVPLGSVLPCASRAIGTSIVHLRRHQMTAARRRPRPRAVKVLPALPARTATAKPAAPLCPYRADAMTATPLPGRRLQ